MAVKREENGDVRNYRTTIKKPKITEIQKNVAYKTHEFLCSFLLPGRSLAGRGRKER
jgi:hypothetical protein